jgi:hypothetical protein
MYKYLAEIRQRVAAWSKAKSSIARELSIEEKAAWEGIKSENLNWINQQGGEKFIARFEPFLKEIAPACW